jgi:hypothetical protein
MIFDTYWKSKGEVLNGIFQTKAGCRTALKFWKRSFRLTGAWTLFGGRLKATGQTRPMTKLSRAASTTFLQIDTGIINLPLLMRPEMGRRQGKTLLPAVSEELRRVASLFYCLSALRKTSTFFLNRKMD